ncbi:MAG TPA: outer membrane protein [Pseudolabrys sp.]|nr:outer membrane protein [Pseudolabrys sp.]
MYSRLMRTGIAAATLFAIPFVAQAADLYKPTYKAPAYTAPAAHSWTGFYIGLNGGYGWGSSSWDSAGGISPKGGLAGATIGYNLQTGSWVWGLEGDIDWSGIKGNVACGAGTCETSNTWLGTARGRIGYAWDNFMPYVTGGAAFGGLKATNSLTGSASTTRIGWTLGAGLEYALWQNWSVKAEYLYADLGKFDCGISCGAAPDNVSFKTNIVRAGINYRF